MKNSVNKPAYTERNQLVLDILTPKVCQKRIPSLHRALRPSLSLHTAAHFCRARIGDVYLGERYVARAILGCREAAAGALRRAPESDEAERPGADEDILAE